MDFSQVKLRKAAAPVEKKPVQLLCTGDNYQALMEEAYLDKYFDSIRAITFRTVFLPITPAVATAINAAHAAFSSGAAAAAAGVAAEMAKLGAAIDQARPEGCEKIFCRLSSRSAKDSPQTKRAELMEACRRELAWVEADEAGMDYPGRQVNQRIHAWFRAVLRAMAGKTGAESVDLLVRSKRIQEDLRQFAEGKIPAPFCVAIREFREIDNDMEFRAFIYNRKVTALTQYNNYVFFPHLVTFKALIEERLLTVVSSKVLPTLPLNNAVVDLLLLPPAGQQETLGHGAERVQKTTEVFVVEVNPLAEFAGTGLFSWEQDREVLLGQKPFEFRFNTKCYDNPFEEISPEDEASIKAI